MISVSYEFSKDMIGTLIEEGWKRTAYLIVLDNQNGLMRVQLLE